MNRPFDRLVVATHNAGKLDEIRAMLAPFGIDTVSAGELGLPEPDETAGTFRGNAAIKAEAARDSTGLPALADDSGLCVDALGGDPGVDTALWGGPSRDFDIAMDRVLSGIDGKVRGAAFIATFALAVPGEETRFFEGRCIGTIAKGKRGTMGHGYDPIFIPDDGDGRTFGEMTLEEKQGGERPLSHRARAMAGFRAGLLEG